MLKDSDPSTNSDVRLRGSVKFRNTQRSEPRKSANKLGEYMTATPSRRRRIIKDQKRPKDFIVPRYTEAQAAIAANSGRSKSSARTSRGTDREKSTPCASPGTDVNLQIRCFRTWLKADQTEPEGRAKCFDPAVIFVGNPVRHDMSNRIAR